MDSVTQVILGAACGEVVLGKKIGGRAMLWGAIGGTIPDLDVFANLFTDEMTALAFHRNFMHSILFALLMPWLLAWLVDKLYTTGFYQKPIYKNLVFAFALILLAAIFGIIVFIPKILNGFFNNPLLSFCIVAFVIATIILYQNYVKQPLRAVEATYLDWVKLFFWSIFTHPILDCFTSYGTQLFQPFNNYRVAFNVVSVVDPIYTLPFLSCLIIAAILNRQFIARKIINWAGIIWSCGYLLFCTWHKSIVNTVFENSMKVKGITAKRYMTSPTIFNNVLWNGVAEGDTAYYFANYSLNDKSDTITFFNIVPKNHEALNGHQNDRDVKILKWFSNNYYHISKDSTGTLKLHDLRFGILNDTLKKSDDMFFKIILEDVNGKLIGHQSRSDDIPKDAFSKLYKRIQGK
ncbi:MAG: metal-dependent hydrolase [Saprospiraceae bacterium]|nr:metal-dependent hydrolase [Saprospiraceae bacterium]